MSTTVDSKHQLIQLVEAVTLEDLRAFVDSFSQEELDASPNTKYISVKIEERGVASASQGLCLILESKVKVWA
jgi:hypothetical protein